MRIVFKTKNGKQHSYNIDALHVTDYYENEYYLDDSTKAEVDETLVVSKYDHKIKEGLYPVWLSHEQQENYFRSTCRDRKIDEILGD
jgi:hypothetical protein